MKKLLSIVLALVMCCAACTAMAENITLKVWEGQDDQELLKELCEAYAALHPENTYTFQYGVVGTADASTRYLEDPAAAADVFVYPDDQLIRLVQADALYEVTRNHDAIVAANSVGSVNAATYKDTLYGYPSSYESGIALAEKAISQNPLPDIILCTNNYIAMACLQVARHKGLDIPDTVAIMTFDNYPFSMLVQPQLTAVEADMYDMGQEAARFILRKVKVPELQTQSYCTIPRIVEREST